MTDATWRSHKAIRPLHLQKLPQVGISPIQFDSLYRETSMSTSMYVR